MQEPVACAKYIAISKFGTSFGILNWPPPLPQNGERVALLELLDSTEGLLDTASSSSGETFSNRARSASRGSDIMFRWKSSFMSWSTRAFLPCSKSMPAERSLAIRINLVTQMGIEVTGIGGQTSGMTVRKNRTALRTSWR